ncbi:MAG TPA: hypothetical protein VHC63_10165 [Acidimicrobiales bacterium]|nr:hypothetical protein [Acidimicrobiales bacterium]
MTASTAARALAEVLLAHADRLDSDDLATISDSMVAVRAAARTVEEQLRARGWGGGVLYGFGDPLDDEDDDVYELESEDSEAGDDGDFVAPPGRKVTWQARYDFVVVDEAKLLAYVERRARELGSSWTRDDIIDHDPLYVLTWLEGFANRDLADTGLVFAGGQDAMHDIEQTLWEMAPEMSDDQFPTAT